MAKPVPKFDDEPPQPTKKLNGKTVPKIGEIKKDKLKHSLGMTEEEKVKMAEREL